MRNNRVNCNKYNILWHCLILVRSRYYINQSYLIRISIQFVHALCGRRAGFKGKFRLPFSFKCLVLSHRLTQSQALVCPAVKVLWTANVHIVKLMHMHVLRPGVAMLGVVLACLCSAKCIHDHAVRLLWCALSAVPAAGMLLCVH